MRARSPATAAAAPSSTARPAFTPSMAVPIVRYQPSTRSGSAGPSPSVWRTVETASGAARAPRSSAEPPSANEPTMRRASSRSHGPRSSRTAPARNGSLKADRCRSCSAPSTESMERPTTCAVEKRGSSTVKVASSRITSSAVARSVTSQPPSAGIQDTGPVDLRRARWGWGSASRSANDGPGSVVIRGLSRWSGPAPAGGRRRRGRGRVRCAGNGSAQARRRGRARTRRRRPIRGSPRRPGGRS